MKISPAFLKMNSTTDIYSECSKIFGTTISRARFCLNVSQKITVYWCDWFYFPVRLKLLLKRETRTPCTDCLKKDTVSLFRYVQAEDCNTRLHETLST